MQHSRHEGLEKFSRAQPGEKGSREISDVSMSRAHASKIGHADHREQVTEMLVALPLMHALPCVYLWEQILLFEGNECQRCRSV
jgi:hypothetical protein